MTENDLEFLNSIKDRIDVLEEEIYALFEAQGKRINPIKRTIRTLSNTKKKDYQHEVEIKLTSMDVRILQDIRQAELEILRKYISEE